MLNNKCFSIVRIIVGFLFLGGVNLMAMQQQKVKHVTFAATIRSSSTPCQTVEQPQPSRSSSTPCHVSQQWQTNRQEEEDKQVELWKMLQEKGSAKRKERIISKFSEEQAQQREEKIHMLQEDLKKTQAKEATQATEKFHQTCLVNAWAPAKKDSWTIHSAQRLQQEKNKLAALEIEEFEHTAKKVIAIMHSAQTGK
jgi:hypothetical protein